MDLSRKRYFMKSKNLLLFSISEDEWNWLLNFITTGGDSLQAYDEYRKVTIENGIYKV